MPYPESPDGRPRPGTVVTGKVSTFGGPGDGRDAGNNWSDPKEEPLAIWFPTNFHKAPKGMFLDGQPEGTRGLARRLDPEFPYIACRWDYKVTSKAALTSGKHEMWIRRKGPRNWHRCYPADWGPAKWTGRVADISPGLAERLGVETDQVVEVLMCPAG